MNIGEQHKTEFLAGIRSLGFEEGLLDDYYDMLRNGQQDAVSWKEYRDFDNSRVLYEPELRRDELGLPYLFAYNATLLETHPIKHGVYGHIDTETIEDCLKDGKWLTDPALFSDLLAQLTELSVCGNSIAKDIAQRLETRYLMGTSATRHINVDWLLKRFGKSHYFRCDQQGLSDVSLIQAYNLMSGRPVLRFEATEPNVYTGYWFGLKRFPEPMIGEKGSLWFEEKQYRGFKPHLLLRKLPINDIEKEGTDTLLIQQLINGGFAHSIIRVAVKSGYPGSVQMLKTTGYVFLMLKVRNSVFLSFHR